MSEQNIKHTLGPFEARRVSGWGDSMCIVQVGKDYPIAKLVRDRRYYTDYVKMNDGTVILSDEVARKHGNYVATPEIREEILKREEADAMLFAAAPELLAALKKVAQALKWFAHGRCRGFDDEAPLPISEAVELAERTIAKALGHDDSATAA